MNTLAKPVGRRSAASRGTSNGQKILLGVLAVILVVILAFELPKVFNRGGSSSSSSSSTSTSAATSNAAAATATAGATASAGTSLGVAPTPASVVRAERVIKRLPARDPFVPLATATAGPSAAAAAAAAQTPAARPAARPAAAAPTKPAALPTGKQLAPTAAVIWTNGRRQVVGVKQSFRVGDQTFKLLSVTAKAAKVSPASGGFKDQITVVRGKPVTLRRAGTGAKYSLNYTLPMTVVGNGR
jgi:hypothetical protein